MQSVGEHFTDPSLWEAGTGDAEESAYGTYGTYGDAEESAYGDAEESAGEAGVISFRAQR